MRMHNPPHPGEIIKALCLFSGRGEGDFVLVRAQETNGDVDCQALVHGDLDGSGYSKVVVGHPNPPRRLCRIRAGILALQRLPARARFGKQGDG